MKNTINFFLEETSYRINQKNLLRTWIGDSIINEGFYPGDINIILCSDAYLYKMNLDYLNHDTYTDIITFDYREDKIISGDLFISIERIKENANIFNKKIVDEIHRVIIHGILHLCDYNDKTELEKSKMTHAENMYLSARPEKLKVV